MRFFLELAYNGLAFHGWQIQPNADSVQEKVESALSTILRQEIKITGAGRTDTGVHARQMFAHFDYQDDIQDKEKWILSLNRLVGKDIFIKNIYKVSEDAHARFDANQRTYKYFISFSKSPFLRDFYWHSPTSLDLEAMNSASQILLNISDFTSFAKLHSDVKTNICDVREAGWKEIKKDEEAGSFLGQLNDGIVFTISADRFLRNMVRAIVGTLVDVGRHKISIERFNQIILDKNRCSAGTSMPPQALFLWNVSYPYL